MINFEVQARSEKFGLMNFPNIFSAMKFAKLNPDVWKISFSLPNGERVRLIRKIRYNKSEWLYDPILPGEVIET